MQFITQDNTKKLKGRLLLIFLLLIAFIIRTYGINFNINNHIYFHPDENTIMSKVHGIIITRDLNPHFFAYPSLYIYIQTILYILLLPLQKVGIDPYLIGRLLTALLGTVTVFLTYKLGEFIFSRKVGLLSALSLTFIFSHVHTSHYITVDVPMTLLNLATFFFAVLIFKTGKLKYYILAGLLGGLTIATKYNFLVIVPIIVGHLLFHWEGNISSLKKAINRNIFFGFLFLPIGFIIGCPFAIFDFPKFSQDLIGMVRQSRYAVGMHGADDSNGFPTWLWYIKYLATLGLYYPFFISSLGGLVIAFKKINKLMILFLCFPLLYYLQISFMSTRFDRYVDPLTPFFAILAGLFIYNIYLAGCKLLRNKRELLLALIGVFFFLIPVTRCLLFDYYLTKEDTRVICQRWSSHNLPNTSRILVIGEYGLHGLLRNKGFKNSDAVGNLDFSLSRYLAQGYEYIIISSGFYHIASNYSNSIFFRKNYLNYKELLKKGTLIQEISYPLFRKAFSNSISLEHSSTLTAYHHPTIQIFKLPKIDSIAEEALKVTYEARELKRYSNGFLVKDPHTSSGEALFNGTVSGPYETYSKGYYEVKYRLKINDNKTDAIVGSIDITTGGAGKVFVKRDIRGTNFSKPNEYQNFILNLVLPEQSSLEFRVHYAGICDLWVDKIEVSPILNNSHGDIQ